MSERRLLVCCPRAPRAPLVLLALLALRCHSTTDESPSSSTAPGSSPSPSGWYTPPTVSGAATTPVEVAAGGRHSCARMLDGTVRCWGSDVAGQLGGSSRDVPVNGLTTVTQIVAGQDHSCALLADGTARCWGRNQVGQLGVDASVVTSSTPLPPVVGQDVRFVRLEAFKQDTCGYTADKRAFCWGRRSAGLNNPPLRVEQVEQVSPTSGQILRRQSDGSVTGRGCPSGDSIALSHPATDVQVGKGFALLLLADGTVRGFGLSASYYCRNGFSGFASYPDYDGLSALDKVSLADCRAGLDAWLERGRESTVKGQWCSDTAHNALGTYSVWQSLVDSPDASMDDKAAASACLTATDYAGRPLGRSLYWLCEAPPAGHSDLEANLAQLRGCLALAAPHLEGADGKPLTGDSLQQAACAIQQPCAADLMTEATLRLSYCQLAFTIGSTEKPTDCLARIASVDDPRGLLCQERIAAGQRTCLELCREEMRQAQPFAHNQYFSACFWGGLPFPDGVASTPGPNASDPSSNHASSGPQGDCLPVTDAPWFALTGVRQIAAAKTLDDDSAKDGDETPWACVLRDDGTVHCWGYRTVGQMADGCVMGPCGAQQFTPQLTPRPIAGLDDATQISLGTGHACAVTAKQQVVCWGDDGTDPDNPRLGSFTQQSGMSPQHPVLFGQGRAP